MNKQVEKIRMKQMGLHNEAVEAEHRPGREAVVIRRKRLVYYQSLERLLEDALDAAEQNPAPIITIDAEAIRKGLESAVANVIAGLTGIAGPPPAGNQPALGSGKAPDALENGEGNDSHSPLDGWLSVPELSRKYGIPQNETGTLYYAIAKGKIKAKGSGRGRKVNEASYLAWKAAAKKS